MKTIYDFPLYYDILFGWDRTIEADFYSAVFSQNEVAKSEPMLEVACGTGQANRCNSRARPRSWKSSTTVRCGSFCVTSAW